GSSHQLVQVLDAVSAFSLSFVVLLESAPCDYDLDHLRQRQSQAPCTQRFDQLDESPYSDTGLAGQRCRTGRFPQTNSAHAGTFLQLLETTGAYPSCGQVDYTQQSPIILGVCYQPQISQRVLDFLAFEETQSAIYPIGQAGVEQGVLQHA